MPVEALHSKSGKQHWRLIGVVSDSKKTAALNSPLAYSRMALLFSEYGNISSHFKNIQFTSAPEDL